MPVKVKARDLKPYHYAYLCAIDGREPFLNTIVRTEWTSNGTALWLGFDTHTCCVVGPDEEVEVVAVEPGAYATERYGAWVLPPRPEIEPTETERLRAEVAKLRGLAALLPGVDTEWRPTRSGWSRAWLGIYDEEGKSIPALLVLETDNDEPLDWSVGDVQGYQIAGGVADTRADAFRDCVAAARQRGVIRE